MEKLTPEQTVELSDLLSAAAWLNSIPKLCRRTMAEVTTHEAGKDKGFPFRIYFSQHTCEAESVSVYGRKYDLHGNPVDSPAELAKRGVELAPEGLKVDPDKMDFCPDFDSWAGAVLDADGIKVCDNGYQYTYKINANGEMICDGYTHNSMLEW